MMRPVTLYMRDGCHLCQDAEALLRRLGCDVVLVDVDQDMELRARYGDEVPVLVIGGRAVLSGVIGEAAARAALAASSRDSTR